ncbi:MAG: putative metal-binding motif-containing protein [Polyangia bacterium]
MARSRCFLLVLVTLTLVRCSPPGNVDTDEGSLLCRTCGGGEDPPPPKKTCYRDNDHDGVGGAAVVVSGTSCPAPYLASGGDCDDSNPAITHGGPCYRDADGDGHVGTFAFYACSCPAGYGPSSDDCNDSDANVFQQVVCPSAIDNDHDGYAGPILMCANPNNCPQAAKHGGDCDDNNAAVHPEQDETAADNIDNDCNGLTDETTFSYYADSSQSTSNSMRIWFKVHDADIINWVRSGQPLWAIVDYVALNETGHSYTSPVLPVTIYTGSLVFGYVDLGGLAPATVWRATLRFVRTADGGAGFTPRGLYAVSSLGYTSPTTLYSTPFFQATMSDGVNPLEQGRQRVVNAALHEWNDSMIGLVKDGNRYCVGYDCNLEGAAGHEWCSEFYNTMLTTAFVSLDPYAPGVDYESANIRNAFAGYGSWSPGTSLLQTAEPGDYLGVGTSTYLHHSEMFLALDSDGHPWMVTGNFNNRVAFSKVPDDPSTWINGMGHLMSNMLK